MRPIDIYAIAATLVSVGVTLFFWNLMSKPGPPRGFGAAQALLVGVGAILAAVVHGGIASVVALAKGPTPAAWGCAALHGAIVLAGVLRAFLK